MSPTYRKIVQRGSHYQVRVSAVAFSLKEAERAVLKAGASLGLSTFGFFIAILLNRAIHTSAERRADYETIF